MTKEEAISKCHKIWYPVSFNRGETHIDFTIERNWVKKSIDAYEALGLLKFDEPEKPYHTSVVSYLENFVALESYDDGLVIRLNGKLIYNKGKDLTT